MFHASPLKNLALLHPTIILCFIAVYLSCMYDINVLYNYKCIEITQSFCEADT